MNIIDKNDRFASCKTRKELYLAYFAAADLCNTEEEEEELWIEFKISCDELEKTLAVTEKGKLTSF